MKFIVVTRERKEVSNADFCKNHYDDKANNYEHHQDLSLFSVCHRIKASFSLVTMFTLIEFLIARSAAQLRLAESGNKEILKLTSHNCNVSFFLSKIPKKNFDNQYIEFKRMKKCDVFYVYSILNKNEFERSNFNYSL